MRRTRRSLSFAALAALAVGSQSQAQYVGPVSPYTPPNGPSYQPYAPAMTPQPYYPTNQPAYYPANNGGYTPGNPSVYYNPNAVVAGNASGSMYWDPQRGWVTNTQQTTVLNSATSPGRAPLDASSVQYYNYWNGSQWVRGSRWLGQDGLWHGEDTNTVMNPNGSSSSTTVYRSAPGGAGATNHGVNRAVGGANTPGAYQNPQRAGYTVPTPPRSPSYAPARGFRSR